jgi:hypothetical protein
MPILAANSSLVLTLTPGQRLSFLVGSGTLQVVPPEPANIGPVFLPIQVGQSVGPWDVTVQYLMRTTQETDYSIFDPAQVPALWSSAAGTALVRPNGSVAPVSSQTVTWATRPTSPALFDQIRVTDIGPYGLPMEWDGTRWRVMFPTVIGLTGGIVTGVTGTAEQYFGGFGPFPAGFLQVGDTLVYQFSFGKTGGSDAFGTSTNIRFGQNGNTGDAPIAAGNLSGTILAATRAGPGIEKWFRVESATTMRAIGSININPSFTGVFVNNIAPETTVGIVNVSTTPWRIGISTTMGGTVGPDAPQLTYQRLTLYP